MVAVGFEQVQLGFGGKSGGRHIGVFKVAPVTLVLAVEEIVVGPFEIKGIADGLAQRLVLKKRLAQIEQEALGAPGIMMRDGFGLDLTLDERECH